jgi:predicted TIM-barrel fold metal-dependent hydrolase
MERARERARLTDLASLEPIDAHTHIAQTGPAFVAMLERLHMHVLDILYVDDTSQYRASLERQKQDALRFIASSRGRATLCTTFDPFQLNDADFSQNAIEALNQDFARGAVAAKLWKNVGMEIKTAGGQYVMPDDPVFQPIYRDIAAQHKTLIIHAADPDGAWDPQARLDAVTGYYAKNPEWDLSKNPAAPRKEAILQARDHLLAMNPELQVVGAHLGSMENELDDLATRLDQFPNFAVDTAARVRRLTMQPRDKVRAFS